MHNNIKTIKQMKTQKEELNAKIAKNSPNVMSKKGNKKAMVKKPDCKK